MPPSSPLFSSNDLLHICFTLTINHRYQDLFGMLLLFLLGHFTLLFSPCFSILLPNISNLIFSSVISQCHPTSLVLFIDLCHSNYYFLVSNYHLSNSSLTHQFSLKPILNFIYLSSFSFFIPIKLHKLHKNLSTPSFHFHAHYFHALFHFCTLHLNHYFLCLPYSLNPS